MTLPKFVAIPHFAERSKKFCTMFFVQDDSRSGHGHERLHPHFQPNSIAHTADEARDFVQKKYVSVSVRELLKKVQS